LINVGVIGVGAMGQHHARLYSELNCKLVGVVDIDLQRAKEIGKKYATRYYTDYHKLLPIVEAISVAVPTSLHYSITMEFLKRGIHCLVEKPITLSMNQARNMINTANKNGVSLAVGHVERFNPAVIALKSIIDQGIIGKLLMISTIRAGPNVLRTKQDVGIVLDSATHDIGVVKYLIGAEPSKLFSRVDNINHPKGDIAVIILDFVDTTACIEVNWFFHKKVRTLIATGNKAIAYLDYIEQKVTIQDSNGIKSMNIQKAEPLRLELEDFLKSVSNGSRPTVDGKEGGEILKIALKASQNRSFIHLAPDK
jgi:UDP-N-acetylglucosamine 3-dehydrogenase